MKTVVYFVILAVFAIPLVAGKLGDPPGPKKLDHDVTDSFQIWEIFETPVAITDADNDTVFECAAAWRTAIDREAKTATYSMDFGGKKYGECAYGIYSRRMEFLVHPGEAPATYVITVVGEPDTYEARYYYTDYENCVVTDLDFHGYVCMLWTTRAVKDNVPQQCIDQFVDTCGVIAPKHSRDLCPDGEGDYK